MNTNLIINDTNITDTETAEDKPNLTYNFAREGVSINYNRISDRINSVTNLTVHRDRKSTKI